MEGRVTIPPSLRGPLPPPSAPAEDVRAYIAQLLVTKHDVPVEAADKYASKWEVGRFSQFVNTPRDALQGIFGVNVGLCVHSGRQEDLCSALDRKASVVVSGYAASISGLALASVVFLAFLPELGLQNRRDRITWALHPAWWMLFAVSGMSHALAHPLREGRAFFFGFAGFFAIPLAIVFLATYRG